MPRRWPDRFVRQAETGVQKGTYKGSGTIMKKVAVTVAVLALGLAACNKAAENNAANETIVENTATTDVNAATNEAVETNAADAALNAPAAENAGNVEANNSIQNK